MNNRTLSLLVDNTPGLLSRVAGLFTRRGYNIDSISTGPTADPRYTRMTIVTSGDEQILEQIEKQVSKLEDVKHIKKLKDRSSVCRELILVKVRASNTERQQVMNMTEIYHGRIVSTTKEAMVVELTGHQDKLDAFLTLLSDYEILEFARTGLTALSRGIEDMISI